MSENYRKTFIGLKTSLGGVITSIDEPHLFKRVRQHKPNIKDIKDAIINPIHTQIGSNQNGSTEYWGKKFIVILVDGGDPKGKCEIKTCYLVKHKKIDKLYKDMKEKEEKENGSKV